MRRGYIVVLVLGALIAIGASYWWNRWLSHDVAHDSSPASHADSTAASGSNARSPTLPPEHMPPRPAGLIHGTKGDDTLYGTESNDRIEALAGNDKIIARGGDDVLNGEMGSDMLIGGLGNDTYVLLHHGGGGDIILEEGGTDTLRLNGRVASDAVEVTRHGDDLLIRWSRKSPLDIVMVRSWFAGPQYRVEQLQMADGTVVPLEPLAARARQATSEDLIHFTPGADKPEAAR